MGRDQLGPIERLTRVLLILESSEPHGVPLDRLLDIADFSGDRDSATRQFYREIRNLNAAGWDIRNVAPVGHPAVYRVLARDNRLRMQFTLEQRAELARAAMAAGDPSFTHTVGIDDPGESDPDTSAATSLPPGGTSPSSMAEPPDHLDTVIYAAANHCLMRFTYKQRRRVVHPHIVSAGVSGWYLAGNEAGDNVVKRFVVARMSDVGVDEPGTAQAPEPYVRTDIDPLSWHVDPPTDVVIDTTADHRPRVEDMLGTPSSVEHRPDDGVRLTITMTHRAAFRWRLYELGTRVHVIGPDDIRAEIIGELAAMAGDEDAA